MPLNYTTLQTNILANAMRPDLSAECPDFIRLCEGMIRRDVRAFETRTTLDETDRSSEGIYNLPDTIQEVRAVYAPLDSGDSYALQNVGLAGIRTLPASAAVRNYAVVGSTIEFRGVPATDAELEIIGIGWPDPLETTATNNILTYHESLYVHGSLFHLYQFTQDLELAQQALAIYTDAAKSLNQQISRRIGGGSVMPGYNFGHFTTGTGY